VRSDDLRGKQFSSAHLLGYDKKEVEAFVEAAGLRLAAMESTDFRPQLQSCARSAGRCPSLPFGDGASTLARPTAALVPVDHGPGTNLEGAACSLPALLGRFVRSVNRHVRTVQTWDSRQSRIRQARGARR
jgi:DivIVA domain-containing protein